MRTKRDLGNQTVIDSAVDLVEFYRIQGAAYLADLGGRDRERSAWRDAMRAKYQVVVDRPCVFIARLITIQSDDRGTVAAGNDFGRKGIKK